MVACYDQLARARLLAELPPPLGPVRLQASDPPCLTPAQYETSPALSAVAGRRFVFLPFENAAMLRSWPRSLAGWIVAVHCALNCAVVGQAAEPEPPAEALTAEVREFFEKQVRPLLASRCYECHGAEAQEAELRLDSRQALLIGGGSGPSVAPGKPDESLLIDAVRHGELVQMPPDSKLPEEEIAVLVKWVELGAPWPAGDGHGGDPVAPKTKPFDLAKRAKFWSFLPVVRPAPPQTENTSWPVAEVDRFVLAKLEAVGLKPAATVDKSTLLRRVTFDLIGLPPTPAELEAFLADDSPQAFDGVVDRLLASPHYGERWARHWLDLVRFAETAGHEFDFELPNAFEYRDYVVRAFNADLPYDQFVLEHIAGDQLPAPRRNASENFNESIIGTGFWYLGESVHSPVDVRADEADRIDNQLDVFGKTFLGLTVACARCHDHKFDAISTKDYYALCGFLQSSRYDEAPIDDPLKRQQIAASAAVLAAERGKLVPERFRKLSETTTADLERYLTVAAGLPSAAIESREPADGEDVLVKAAAEAGLDAGRLRAWAERLERARGKASDPLHALAVLGQASPSDFALARQTVLERLRNEPRGKSESTLLVSFAGPDYATWTTSGEAFGAGPSQTWQVLPKFGEQDAHALVPPGVAHSGLLAPRLEGALRSPTFEITGPKIAYRVAGRGGRLRLIIDGFQRIQDPIYGGLAINLEHGDELRWLVRDVSKWVGHRAYIELLDRGPGYAALEQVIFLPADGSPPNAQPSAELLAVLERENLASLEPIVQLAATELRQVAQAMAAGGKGSACAAQANLAVDLWNIAKLGDALPDDLVQRERELDASIAYGRRAMIMVDGTGENERVHIRGNPKNLGDLVDRRFLEALPGGNEPLECNGSGRLELAQRMASADNPLLARVLVNRLWKQHFGTGLVATPDDFGHMGEAPSHPELLDWLANQFIASGWSLKSLHRQMVLSAVYQQASDPCADAESIDPNNRLLHRMPVRRLEAEAIRDAVLAVSGRLDRTVGGPSVIPYLSESMVGRGRPAESGPLDGEGRRTLYVSVRRNFLTPLQLAFDYPQPFSTVGRRGTTNVPAQALALLNNPFIHAQARQWAERLLAEEPDATARLTRMYLQAFARQPTAVELQSGLAFVSAERETGVDEAAAWAEFGHVLFNVKEFIFLR